MRKRILGVCHLLPLPGSPRARPMKQVLQRALDDARALERGGVDGIVVENYGDRPFAAGAVGPETVASMAAIASEIRRAVRPPLGVNILRNDARSAMAVAHAAGAEWIRVNVLAGAYVAGEGLLIGDAAGLLRYRESLDCRVRIFADLLVKHAQPLAPAPVESLARDLAYRAGADALIVTGAETGREPDRITLRAVRQAVPDREILVGSGLHPDNMDLLEDADGAIVGTWFKAGGRTEAPVDVRRVRALMRRIR
jgi:membrane complex biogenesis BtpA family protein